MTNFTFIKSTIQEIDESFREEGFTAVERLVLSLNPPNISTPTSQPTLPNMKGDFELTRRNDNYNILLDTRNGRVSRGVKSLLTLSRIIAGRPASSMKLLTNNAILFSNEKQILASNTVQLRNIVLANLGIQNLIEPAQAIDPTFVSHTIDLVDRMGNDVKHGIFKSETYMSEILARSKALVNMANSTTIKRENNT